MLVLSLLISVAAMGVLYGLYDRQRQARANELAARVYSAQLEQAITDLVPVGLEFVVRDPQMVGRLTRTGVAGGVKRAETLRAVDPEVTDRLIALLNDGLTKLDAPLLDQVALLDIAEEAQKLVNDLAEAQRAKADSAAIQGLLGSFGALTAAVLLIGGLLTRERRRSLAAAAEYSAAVRELADHDGLTGLPNRRRFDADLEALGVAGSAPAEPDAVSRGPVEIALCDLDGFKAINDRLGHHAGDDFLVETAEALVAAIADAGTVYRIGGDEFCAISRPGRQVGEAVRRSLQRDGQAPIGSVGCAIWPADHAVAEDVVRLADHRMYAAKRAQATAAPADLAA